LPVGSISPVLKDSTWFSVYKVLDQREQGKAVRASATQELRNQEIAKRAEQVSARYRKEIKMTIDSSNVAWVAKQFPHQVGGTANQVVIDVSVPKIPAADTARILATSSAGRVTVGRLLEYYRALPDLQRPSLDTPETVRQTIDVILLEPYYERTAREMGLDKDPMAISLIERRREELLVEHLYQDSIMSKIFIPPADRRKYYKDRQHQFVTAPNAEFAVFGSATRKGADSVVARLRGGESASQILRADSLGGRKRGMIRRERQDEQGKEYHKLVFEELKPGETTVVGTEATGGFTVVHLISLDSGREVPFEEADAQIDEYLTNEAAEKLFAAFLERHKRKIKPQSHPEWVMRVRLVDPMDS